MGTYVVIAFCSGVVGDRLTQARLGVVRVFTRSMGGTYQALEGRGPSGDWSSAGLVDHWGAGLVDHGRARALPCLYKPLCA